MIVLTDQSNNKVRVPVCWEDTSTAMFQRYVSEWDNKDRIKLFCIQTGYDYDKVKASTDIDLEAIIERTTDYVFNTEVHWDHLAVPKTLKVSGKWIALPKKIEELTIEQNLVIKSRIMLSKDIRELLSVGIAVYIQPIVDGSEFDHDRYKEIEKEILAMPILDTYALGFFLLSRLRITGKSGVDFFKKNLQKLTKNVKISLN